MRYFTSDIHFGDKTERLNLYGRHRLFTTQVQFETHIITQWNNMISQEDDVYFLGDFAVSIDGYKNIKKLNGNKHLILGNYEYKIKDFVNFNEDFLTVQDNLFLKLYNEEIVYLNHYPERCVNTHFNICGHIHGLWQVQRNMLNVGVDAWNLLPVSENDVIFKMNAIRKYYDINVFAGELNQNKIS